MSRPENRIMHSIGFGGVRMKIRIAQDGLKGLRKLCRKVWPAKALAGIVPEQSDKCA